VPLATETTPSCARRAPLSTKTAEYSCN
jgi:hypothetical protein